jgi:glutathione S-transferase
MKPILYIGNKNYSSWSLRPWLVLKWAGIAFEERVILLGGQGYGKSRIPEVLAVSPSGRVPALELPGARGEGAVTVWDSLAICEWAAEQARDAALWPAEPLARAVCRSVVSEMHSSFAAVRRDLSMNIRRRTSARAWPEDTRADIARLDELWCWAREQYGGAGPHLFGQRTIADAFFTPVATRFRTYGVKVSAAASAYAETLLGDPAFREWESAAQHEAATIAETEAL